MGEPQEEYRIASSGNPTRTGGYGLPMYIVSGMAQRWNGTLVLNAYRHRGQYFSVYARPGTTDVIRHASCISKFLSLKTFMISLDLISFRLLFVIPRPSSTAPILRLRFAPTRGIMYTCDVLLEEIKRTQRRGPIRGPSTSKGRAAGQAWRREEEKRSRATHNLLLHRRDPRRSNFIAP